MYCCFYFYCIPFANILEVFYSTLTRVSGMYVCNILVRFWYQGDAGTITWAGRCFLFHHYLKDLVLDCIFFFLKCLWKFTSKATCVWSFLCVKADYKFNIFMEYKDIRYKILQFFARISYKHFTQIFCISSEFPNSFT